VHTRTAAKVSNLRMHCTLSAQQAPPEQQQQLWALGSSAGSGSSL
jgi:hypothetical protein